MRTFAAIRRAYTVIYLQRSKVSIYLPGKKAVAEIDFPPTVLSDVQVVDQEQFTKLISKTLAQYKNEPGPVLVILANDVCFTLSVTPEEKDGGAGVLQQLRRATPFSNVFTRIIKLPKQIIALSLNRDFFEPLLTVLREQKYEVTTMVPEIALTQQISGNLTAESAQSLAESVTKLEAYDLLESQEKRQLITTTAQSPEDKKRTVLLVGVFVALLAVLAAVWWWSNRQAPAAPVVVPTIPVASMAPLPPFVPEATPLSPLTAEPAATESASDSGLLSVEPVEQPRSATSGARQNAVSDASDSAAPATSQE